MGGGGGVGGRASSEDNPGMLLKKRAKVLKTIGVREFFALGHWY